MPRGGKRPGAGRKKGYKEKQTLDKEAAREFLRERVKARLGPMVDAQIDTACGIKYLVAREKKSGKFKRMTEADAILKLGQESETEVIEIWEKDPSTPAFTDLLNRTLDRPVEQVQADVTGDILVRWKAEE